MRKISALLLVLLLAGLLLIPSAAASDPPEITLQPQSPNYPEYSVAIYTVKATGSNLRAFWYMEWLGQTYCISDIGGAMQPWEPFAGEAYGANQLDSNTFAFIFEGLEYDLDGAYIWCVIEDGHFDVVSQKARISVGNPNTPPEIVSIPSKVTVQQGQEAEVRCVARSNDGTQLSFLWYETATGRMEDMIAVNRGEETSDYMILDTSRVGTRYYFCKVDTSNGGMAYSSMVEVKVEQAPAPTTPAPTTPAPTTLAPTTPAPTTPVPTTPEPVAQTTPSPTQPAPGTTPEAAPSKEPSGNGITVPWWGLALMGVVIGGMGASIVVLASKRK